MSDHATPNAELIAYIDEWIDANAWRLDERIIDFALDVRLMAAGTSADAAESVATMAGV
ncbi:MAG: hypothetical protein GY720_19390 [bacterium]|nr:hypothetical protein [bacterium]